jgi:hypothetical protein
MTAELAAEIEKQSVYVSAAISRMRVSLVDREVEVELTGHEDQTSTAKAERFLASMLASLDRGCRGRGAGAQPAKKSRPRCSATSTAN